MSIHLNPRLDALPAPQRALWPNLRRATELGFVLYGGTAIALRYGHRVSEDFDFFSDLPVEHTALAWVLDLPGSTKIGRQRQDSVTYFCSTEGKNTDPVKVSFFSSIDFGRIGNPQITDDGVMQIASPEDLLATKLKVMLQRSEAKDYLDVIALLDAGVKLETGLAGARALFGNAFQPMEALRALTFFEDGNLNKLTTAQRQFLLTAAAKKPSALPTVPKVSMTLLLS